jgi:hypothetical protein
VVLTFGHMLVAGLAVAELDLPGNPRFGEELQCPVNRGVADPRILGTKFQIELLDTHVAVRGEKGVEDHIALAGGLEPLGGNKLAEYLFLGALQSAPQLKVIFTLYIFSTPVNLILHLILHLSRLNQVASQLRWLHPSNQGREFTKVSLRYFPEAIVLQIHMKW